MAEAFNEMKRRIAQFVEELTLLLAGIAHDIRAYLTCLRLRVDYIKDAEERVRAERDLEQTSVLLDDSLLFAGIGLGPSERS